MNALIQKVEAPFLKHDLPSVRVGDTVRILFKVSRKKESDSKEKVKAAKSTKLGKEKAGGSAKGGRSQAYEGVVIAQHGVGLNKSLTVRRISYGVGVEKVVPLHSPAVEAIEVLKPGRPRRAKLFYLRQRVGKQALKVKPRRPKEVVKEAAKAVVKSAAENNDKKAAQPATNSVIKPARSAGPPPESSKNAAGAAQDEPATK